MKFAVPNLPTGHVQLGAIFLVLALVASFITSISLPFFSAIDIVRANFKGNSQIIAIHNDEAISILEVRVRLSVLRVNIPSLISCV